MKIQKHLYAKDIELFYSWVMLVNLLCITKHNYQNNSTQSL